MFRLIASVAALVVATGAASAAPVLESLAPTQQTFVLFSDYVLPAGTGTGDVTASVFAVDLFLPPGPTPSSSTSGCEAADFAGFTAGSIALIQRGTCEFTIKATNAAAAGAAGVLIFNEGQPGRTDAIGILVQSTLPLFSLSFNVGQFFSNGITQGSTGVIAHMEVSADDFLTVPEPGSFALIGAALAAAGIARRRRAD